MQKSLETDEQRRERERQERSAQAERRNAAQASARSQTMDYSGVYGRRPLVSSS